MMNRISISLGKQSSYISDEQVEEIAKLVSEEAMDALNEQVLDPQLQEIRIEAAKFLTVYRQQETVLLNLSNMLERQKMIRESYGKTRITKKDQTDMLERDYAEYVENNRQIRMVINDICNIFYPELFNFQNKLNAFLDQEAITVISYKGELYRVTTENYMKMLNFSVYENALSARYSTAQKKLQNFATKIDTSTLNQENLGHVKHGRNSALWRFNRSKKINSKDISGGFVMWESRLNNSKWEKMKVSSRGDIEEAYATIILQRQENLFASSDISDILDIFMFQFVSKVDNLSGMLEGDTTVENIEYAIKSVDSSVLGIKQFETLAQEILKTGWSKEKLQEKKKELEKKASTRNRLIKGLEESVEQNLTEIFNEIKNEEGFI